MDERRVEEFVSRSRDIIDRSPQMDEENTKAKLIRPFLELLGWDFYSPEVSLEHRVRIGSGNTYVDYALLIGDSPKVFVEAKSVRDDLSQGELTQLKSYMRQELEVDWGILTNGRTFEVLAKNQYQDDSGEISVAQFDLEDLSDDHEVLDLLTKEAIRSGEASEIARQIARTNDAIRRIRDGEDALATTIVESIEDVAGPVPIELDDHARTFVRDLVSALEDQRDFVADTQPDAPSPDDPAIDGYAVRFSDGTTVPPSGADSQVAAMGLAVEHLIEEHDLLDEIELPYLRPRAQSNCALNSDPVHPDGREMRSHYELPGGVFLHTHLNGRQKRTHVEDFADEVGLSVEFRGGW